MDGNGYPNMELIGIANMKVLLEMGLMDSKIDQKLANDLNEQLDILMNYMKMYKNATSPKWVIRPWHEVREEYYATTRSISKV